MKNSLDKSKKKSEQILFYVSLSVLLISLIFFSINVFKTVKLTGYVTGTGTANLTISSVTQINFTTNTINWGTGSVTSGQANATLNTAGGANNITNGNWTGNTAGLIIENIGNQNVTLDIKTGKSAATFVGGTNPEYKYNITNVETNSCTNSTGFNLGTFYDVNTTNPGTRVCDVLFYNNSVDTLRIDIKLVIPSDATQTGSAIGDIITATATATS